MKGDMSNTVVHPMFVYQACSYGMYFAQSFVRTPAALDFQAKYAQFVWEELAKVQKGSCNYLKAQAMLSICSCCIVFRWIDFARQYVQKACRVINAAGLQFIPTYGQPPKYSEEVRERSTVLSQVIYFENYLFLAHGGREPELTARIEKEFLHELQVWNRGSRKPVYVTHLFHAANVSDAVQDLSVDHEDAGHFASQGCDPSSQLLVGRWWVCCAISGLECNRLNFSISFSVQLGTVERIV